MSRYVIVPSSDRVETPYLSNPGDWPLLPSVSVDGPVHVDTKLIDRHGNAIMRVQDPIGFGRDRER